MKETLIKQIIIILKQLSIDELKIVLQSVSDILTYGKTNEKD